MWVYFDKMQKKTNDEMLMFKKKENFLSDIIITDMTHVISKKKLETTLAGYIYFFICYASTCKRPSPKSPILPTVS